MNLKKSGVRPNFCGFPCLHHTTLTIDTSTDEDDMLLVNEVLAAILTLLPNYFRYRSGAGNVSTNSAPGS